MKKIVNIVFFTLIFTNIFSQIQSYPIDDENLKLNQNSVCYYLPKTNLFVEIEVQTEYFIPGPFCHFSDKYLLIKNVNTDKKITSKITNVVISEYIVPDTKNCFIAIEKNYKYKLSLNNTGILSAYNIFDNQVDMYFPQITNTSENLNDNIPFFTDYTVKKNFIGKTDTTYKVVQVDSVFHKIPIYNQQITSKNFEQKAEEAANFIIKIRKRKFKLQIGQFETELPPANVPEMIKELDNLEQQYTELFVGKNIVVSNKFYFDYSPTKTEEIIMFFLSEEKGIIPQIEKNAKPVILKIEDLKTTNNIETKLKNSDKQKAGLYYRIPGMAMVSIIQNTTTISRQQIIMPQFGTLNFLPDKMFSSKTLKITFDTKNGSIKSIYNE